jgi:glycosyltransferase involved in cell wall biosynthesis
VSWSRSPAAELFRPLETDLRQDLGLADRDVVLYVGRFVPLKNLPLLVSAFAIVKRERPSARLVLVGEGALEHQIRVQVKELRLDEHVVFLGQQSQQRLPELYAAADVVALSSSFDNSPNAVLEAGACERPVVATRVGGVPRYVTDGGNGLLAEPGDAEGFARATLRLLSDPALRREMGEDGRRRVLARHSWRRSAEKLLALYETLLAAPARATGG